jgi:hypothetical protein
MQNEKQRAINVPVNGCAPSLPLHARCQSETKPKETAVEGLRICVEFLTGEIHEIEREDRLSFVSPPSDVDTRPPQPHVQPPVA